MLELEACRSRQERLRARLETAGLDAVVISDPRDIYYFTGVLLAKFPAMLFLRTAGGSWLAAHDDGGDAVVDERLTYEWHKLYTMNPDPLTRLNEVVGRRIGDEKGISRVGWQAESLPALLAETISGKLGSFARVMVDGLLEELQKCKDPDEVDLLQKSIHVSLAAYDAAQKAIVDGANELEVLGAGTRGSLVRAEEVVFHGGDYACAAFGGPARNRKISAGELYIIDAQSTYRGYWSDLSRTFVVGGKPTDLQQSVYDHLASILLDVPNLVKPGGHATELWQILDARIRDHPHLADSGLVHHGGHGVGLRPHEAPDLNLERDGVFGVGDVFSCEPGAYGDDLGYGIRLENTFWISEKGVELLSDYPLDLIPKS